MTSYMDSDVIQSFGDSFISVTKQKQIKKTLDTALGLCIFRILVTVTDQCDDVMIQQWYGVTLQTLCCQSLP